jgi:ADP-ribose pyrophosphatase YjhB (NUDIX family)
LSHARVWKLVGDEVLFYLRVTNIEEIYLAIPYLLDATKEVEKEIQEVSMSHDKLFIKTAAWIAHVENAEKENDKDNTIATSQNRYYLSTEDITDNNIDFLGFQIDEGFRIGGFARQNVIVLGASLALLLLKDNSEVDSRIKKGLKKEINKDIFAIKEKIRVIAYEKLKGIWRGHYYPILWYCDSWKTHDIFQYDETYNTKTNKYIEKLKEQKNINFSEQKKLSVLEELERIFKDINLPIPDFKKTIEESEKKPLEIDKKSEMHVTLICTNKDVDKVLLVLRSSDEPRFPGVWEFGCGYIKKEEIIKEAITRTYKEKFNLTVEILNETPISTYHFRKNENTIVNGLIFIGYAAESKIDDNNKYEKIEFKSLEDIQKIDKEKCMDKLQENVEKGVKEIKKILK